MKITVTKQNPDVVIKQPSDYWIDAIAVTEQEIAPDLWAYGLGLEFNFTDKENSKITMMLLQNESLNCSAMVCINPLSTIPSTYNDQFAAIFRYVDKSQPRYKIGDKVGELYLIDFLPIEIVEK